MNCWSVWLPTIAVLNVNVASLHTKGIAAYTGPGKMVGTVDFLLNIIPASVAGLALILGIDRFMSEARALTNLVGNDVATLVVAKWTGELDTKRFQVGLNNQAWVESEAPEVILDKKVEHMAVKLKAVTDKAQNAERARGKLLK